MAGSDPETTLGRLLRRLPHEASCDGLAPITGRSTKPAIGYTLELDHQGPITEATERKTYVRTGSSLSVLAEAGSRSGRSSPRATADSDDAAQACELIRLGSGIKVLTCNLR